jgi:restriction system protein
MPISKITTVGARHGRVAYVANYAVDVWHESLNRRRTITGPIEPLIRLQAESLLAQWEAEWQAQQNTQEASESECGANGEIERRAAEASELQMRLRTLFAAALSTERLVGWGQFRSSVPYPIPKPEVPPVPSTIVIGARTRPLPPEPLSTASAYVPQLGFFDRLIPFLRAKKENECEMLYVRDHKRWKAKCEQVRAMNADDQRRYEILRATTQKQYEADLLLWDEERRHYEIEQLRNNELIKQRDQEYQAGEPAAIGTYCDMILNSASYPLQVIPIWRTDYIAAERTLNVECTLPPRQSIPTLYDVVAAPDHEGGIEKHLTSEQVSELHESVICQICLRSLYELFKSDVIRAIDRIVFTGGIAGEGSETESVYEDSEPGDNLWIALDVSREAFMSLPLCEESPRTLIRYLQGGGDSGFHIPLPLTDENHPHQDARYNSMRSDYSGMTTARRESRSQ